MIILNTHARTGSYFAHNVIMDNLVKQDKSYAKVWNEALTQIVATMNNLDIPTAHNYLKNPIEPFAGMSLDVYGVDHLFGSNYQDIADELHLLVKSKKWPFSIANIWEEKEYADVKRLKEEEGYEVVSLYRRDKLKWFLSTVLVVANNDVRMFHAYDDESRDYIVNRRKELDREVKLMEKNKKRLNDKFTTLTTNLEKAKKELNDAREKASLTMNELDIERQTIIELEQSSEQFRQKENEILGITDSLKELQEQVDNQKESNKKIDEELKIEDKSKEKTQKDLAA